MKICIASLSKRIIYNDVLQYGMSDFYECLNQYVKNNPQHEYTYYNFSFGKGAKRDLNQIIQADIIIFPAAQEFTYFTQVMHPRDVEKVRVKVRETFPYLQNKHMIMLTQDRHVNEELIITKLYAISKNQLYFPCLLKSSCMWWDVNEFTKRSNLHRDKFKNIYNAKEFYNDVLNDYNTHVNNLIKEGDIRLYVYAR